ncbi:MAG: hypothetical protein K2N00_00530 [Lachnospiraceae bacterium]|nr:hypothetical protein [Lachnospiraceae bacterium]
MAMVLFCFWAFGIGSTYGFSIFPDEFAYWSYAARVNGYDWSAVTSLAPYYSYGYSLILIPIFALFKNAVTAYRVAVSINFIFLYIGFAALVRTMRSMVSDKKIPIILFSALAILLPCNLFYTQITLTEVFLVCLYITAGALLFHYLESDRLSTLFMLMLTLMYLYTVHMRTVGVLLSAIMVLVFHILSRKERRWHILVVLGTALVLFILADMLKQYAYLSVYGGINRELVADNDYSGQLAKIQYIFTGQGFYDFVIHILGKILYLGLATWGVFYWGVYVLIKHVGKMLQSIKKHIPVTTQQMFALFVLFSVILQIVISTIYLLTLGEIGDYTYGRYNEMVIPFVMVLGLVTLWQERTKTIWGATGVLAVVQMAITFLVVRQIMDTGAENFQGYFMVGIAYLYEEAGFQVGSFYRNAWLLCEVLTVLVTAVILFCRNFKKRQYFMIALVIAELVMAMQADTIYLEPFKKAAFRDSRMVDKINVLQEDGRKVVYMDDVFPPYVGIIQFMDRDMDIRVMEQRESVHAYEKDIRADDILIFAFDDVFLQEWEERYTQIDVYGHFALLYND